MADVNLVDLEVIKRYSLAIRQESAPADEVLAVLDLSREAVLAAMADAPRKRAATAKAPAKAPLKSAAKRAPAKKAARGAAPKKAAKKAASATRRRSR